MFDVDWGLDGSSVPALAPVGRTLGQLIEDYKADPVSGYRGLRYATFLNHQHLLRRMAESFGHKRLDEIRTRTLAEMYQAWSRGGTKVSTGHTFMSKLRTLCGYGASMLEDDDCIRLCIALGKRKYQTAAAPKETFLNADQATAVREIARKIGWFSIAMAQALQFDGLLRQKDCIGEWIPIDWAGPSDVVDGDFKWVRGVVWDEIDEDLVLDHITSKKGKRLILPLSEAPMVMEEFRYVPDWLKRYGGPLVVCEHSALPWKAVEFRRRWRSIADICGIPSEIKNMDSRSGGITEGSDAGIPLEHMRHAAKHSDIQMTQRYSRDGHRKAAQSLRGRVAYRSSKVQARDGARTRVVNEPRLSASITMREASR